MKKIILASLFLLTSCANYVTQMHKSFDASDKKKAHYKSKRKDQFDMFRSNEASGPNSLYPSTANQRNLKPSVQRNYQEQNVVRKRYRAEDLTDQSNNASLWGNDDNAQYLFTQATEKKMGEIILINVNSKLKKSISAELKRAFPDPLPFPKRKGADAGGDKKDGGEEKKTAEADKPKDDAGADADNTTPGTIHDRISSVIVEKINKNHLLLKGRKKLLYKKRKRTVEIQALISKKDITSEDSVNSDDILESTIRVVR